MHLQHIKHLYFRAGFGPDLAVLSLDEKPTKLAQKLLKDSQNFEPLYVGKPPKLPESRQEVKMMSDENKRMLKESRRKSLKALNSAWIHRMASTQSQLREKLTLFWHDHFACRLPLQFYITQQQNNTLRLHAMGKFGDLLHAVSKDAGMLRFLNNQQNKKGHPNENFAREVMELFTLGRGHYTEQDIKEAARAFTGWSSNMKGEFIFRKGQHDFGTKTFLGRSGNFGGEDILNILLEERQTAQYLTEKFYAFFVNRTPKQEVINAWAKSFYESEYDIAALMERIFTSDHFYEKENVGSRIKSPIEYLVSMMRLLNLRFEDEDGPIFIQKMLGQTLFSPPNVSGWPDGRAWIDSSSIMSRMTIPQALIMATEINMNPKSDFAGNEDVFKGGGKRMMRKLKGEIDWTSLFRYFRSYDREKKLEILESYLLQVDSPFMKPELLRDYLPDAESLDGFKRNCLRYLCTPEFQLC